MSDSPDIIPPQTVFVVDDDDAIREGLANLLEAVGIASEQFASAEDFLRGWDPSRPGCLVLDARLPGMTGVEFQEELRASSLSIPIIFMTAHGDVPMVRKVMKAGAVEFLTKPFEKQELLTAIEHAFALDRERRAQNAESSSLRERYSTLSPREREVMELVTVGMLNKQIAGELNLSEITVKLHRRHVLEKMEAGSLADLVKMAEKIRAANIG
ncbi:MAG TPA: response regulator transcription factor [Acidobacteriaceae bacterium]|nr:response regulator transcription factor [Acidobacteriaceae bacterium]